MATPTGLRRRGRVSFILGIVIAAGLIATFARADVVTNTLDNTIDAAPEVMNLTAGGANGSTQLYVQNTNQNSESFPDTNNGCNLAGNNTDLTVDLVSSDPTKATVSPSQLTFAACGDPNNAADPNVKTITVTPLAAGSTTISATQAAYTGTGVMNLSPATFTVNVAPPPDNSPPNIQANVSPAPNGDGWNNSTPVNLSWTITDPQSPASVDSGCVNETFSVETSGETRSCTASSAGGTATASVTIKIDKTEPVISADTHGYTPGTWTNESVTVDFSCADVGPVQSGLKTDTVGGGGTFSSDSSSTAGTGVTNTGSCVDFAGNEAQAKTVNVKIDKTPPTISPNPLSPAPNANGWNRSDVTVSWDCDDALSGEVDASVSTLVTDEGANQAIVGTCEDEAGNETQHTQYVSIDKTDPVISVSHVANGSNGWNVSSPVTLNIAASDALSGLAGLPQCLDGFSPLSVAFVSGSLFQAQVSGEGVHAVSCSVADAADNEASTSDTVMIDTIKPSLAVSHTANGSNGWNTTPTVALAVSSSDGGSGLAAGSPSCTDNGSSLALTHVSGSDYSATVSGEGQHSIACAAEDVAGNDADPASDLVKIDSVKPVNVVTGVSDGARYTLGGVPPAGCVTSDPGAGDSPPTGSGVATSATVAVGGGTSNGVGAFTATCSGGSDNAGNLADSAVAVYYVGYAGATGFLQPINPDGSSLFQRGKAVPGKFQLAGDELAPFDTSGWLIRRIGVQCGTAVETTTEAVGSVSAWGVFRYDALADQYIYNADFRDKAQGTCWKLRAILDDGNQDVTNPSVPANAKATYFDSAVFKLGR